jgi:tetratricopeptide (TPR) repeat protein
VSELGVAEALGELFEHSGEGADLTEAIRLGQEAMRLHPKGDPERSRACANLALCYHTRFEHSGDEYLLDAAVNFQREVLSLRSKGHPDRLATCMNLALFLTSACDANPNEALLFEAIALEDEAREICPIDDPDRAELWSNTAMSRIKLFHILEHLERRDPGDLRLLDEAIRYQKEAIEMVPTDHRNIGGMMNNLGSLLNVKFEEAGDVSIMKEIAELRQRALDLEPLKSRKRWRALCLLASVHSNVAYADRDIGIAIRCVVEALESNADSLPRLLHEVADTLLPLAKMRMDNAQRSALLNAYSSAIDFSAVVTGFILDPDLQLEYLSPCTTLAPGAYITAMQLGDTAAAVTLLDRARGVMWSQMLQVRRPDLQGVPDGLLVELQNLLSDLNRRESSESGSDSSSGSDSDSDSSSTADDEELDWDALGVQLETEHTT